MNPNDPWGIPPMPMRGDNDIDTTYAAVGRTLSQWELYEAHWSLLFVQFIAPGMESVPARRAYGSLASFTARADMLFHAGKAFFDTRQLPELSQRFVEALKTAKRASPRRNDIAHGIVQPYGALFGHQGFVLFPAYYNSRRRNPIGIADYAYSSVELELIRSRIEAVTDEPLDIATEIAALPAGPQ